MGLSVADMQEEGLVHRELCQPAWYYRPVMFALPVSIFSGRLVGNDFTQELPRTPIAQNTHCPEYLLPNMPISRYPVPGYLLPDLYITHDPLPKEPVIRLTY